MQVYANCYSAWQAQWLTEWAGVSDFNQTCKHATRANAMATMSIPAGLFPTDLDHDQQDKVEMDRSLLRVWFASKHHHAISRCVLSRWRASAHGAFAVAHSCRRKQFLNSSSTKKAFAKR